MPARDTTANMFLGRELVYGGLLRPFALLKRRKMVQFTTERLDELGIVLPSVTGVPIGRLSGGQRQAVAVARASCLGDERPLHGRADRSARRPADRGGARARAPRCLTRHRRRADHPHHAARDGGRRPARRPASRTQGRGHPERRRDDRGARPPDRRLRPRGRSQARAAAGRRRRGSHRTCPGDRRRPPRAARRRALRRLGPRARRLVDAQESGLLAANIVLFTVMAVWAPGFVSAANFRSTAALAAYTGMMSAVATLVLISGGLDLSVGAVAVLAGQACALALNAGWSTAARDRRRARDRCRGRGGQRRSSSSGSGSTR